MHVCIYKLYTCSQLSESLDVSHLLNLWMILLKFGTYYVISNKKDSPTNDLYHGKDSKVWMIQVSSHIEEKNQGLEW